MPETEDQSSCGGSERQQLGTVDTPPNGAFLELHDVLGQSSCLVRKDVLDLTELFVQSGGSSLEEQPRHTRDSERTG